MCVGNRRSGLRAPPVPESVIAAVEKRRGKRFRPPSIMTELTGLISRRPRGWWIFLIMLALVLLFVLGALYESWMPAFSVMFSTIFAILGALAGLHMMGQPLSIYAQLGFGHADRSGG